MKKKILIIYFLIAFVILTVPIFFISEPYNDSGEALGERFYLYGPDPYYNMRMAEEYLEDGRFDREDPLLDYPEGSGIGRPPLFVMISCFATTLTEPVLGEDALGWMMLLIPSLFGALLVIPVFYLGKEVLGSETLSLVAVFLIPIVPFFLTGGHGASIGLFDHDSFLIFLFTLFFYFFVKMLKEKDFERTWFYVGISVVIGLAISLTWVVAETLLVMVTVFMVGKFIVDSLKNEYNDKMMFSCIVAIALSVELIFLNYSSIIIILIGAYLILTALYEAKKADYISRTCSLLCIGLVLSLSSVLMFFRIGIFDILRRYLIEGNIYASKVHITISEGNVFSIYQIAEVIGPIVFILFIFGMMQYIFKTIDERKDYQVFIVVISGIYLYFVTQASRFIADFIPLIVLFSVFGLLMLLRSLPLGSLTVHKKKIGTLALAILLVSNIAFSTAALGDAYDFSEEKKWSKVGNWFSERDVEFDEEDRPGILAWWDYGFFLMTIGDHPVVSDNFQNGYIVPAMFFASESESEALGTLVVRMMDDIDDFSGIDDQLVSLYKDPVGVGSIIDGEYHNMDNKYVRVTDEGAKYLSCIDYLDDNYDIDEIWELYEDVNGENEIGYIAISEKDVKSIAPVIFFHADKGVWPLTGNDSYFNETKVPTEKAKNTMLFRLYNEEEFDYFEKVKQIDDVKIFKIKKER